MAVKSNSSEKPVVNEFNPKSGPALVKVVAINPTLEQLVAIGYTNIQNEPEYLSDAEAGHKKCRVDIYVENTDLKFRSKVSIFLENKVFSNKDGNKFQFINDFAQSTWNVTVEDAVAAVGKNNNTWFKPEGARQALIGEVNLYDFIKAWANVAPGDECKLDNIANIFKGNFKELQQLVKDLKDNSVYVMATVTEKDNKHYQNISNGLFGRATSKKFANDFMEYAAKQKESGYPLKYTYSVTWKDFVPTMVVPDADPAQTGDLTPSEEEADF